MSIVKKLRSILQWFSLGFIVLFVACNPSTRQPNVIVILMDDMGYADAGFMGSKDLDVPNIDQLASEGVVFTDAHVSATVCSPSRAGLITGRYQQRFGHECNVPPAHLGIDTTEMTIGHAMQQAGYKTIAIGKWHVGDTQGRYPNNMGFDEFFGFREGSRSYWSNKNNDKDGSHKAIEHNNTRVDFEGYLTDVFGDKAVEYVDHKGDKPIFMYLAFNAPHTPMHAKKEHLEKYKDHPRKNYASMMWSADENIGKLVNKLKENGEYDNTLFFFLSDNGGAHNNESSCEPLKGWKGNKFEGGHRVPFFVTWKNGFDGGRTFKGLTSALDIMSTSIASTGIEVDLKRPLDGVDLLPYLKGETAGAPHQILFWRKEDMAAVRLDSLKLIRLNGYGYRLYNLNTDPGESEGLQKQHPRLFKSLKRNLEDWEKDLIEPKWLEGIWNDVTYEIHQALMENREPNYTDPWQMKKFGVKSE